MSQIEVFVLTCGVRPSFDRALQSVINQQPPVKYTVIKDVAPMSAAFNRMLELSTTPYFVQCDDDMILAENAVSLLHGDIAAPYRPKTAIAARWLWDVHCNRPIVGVKAYNKEAIAQVGGWRDVQSCEVDQITRLRDAQWHVNCPYEQNLIDPPFNRESVLLVGVHDPMFTPETAYERYRDLMLKQRRFGQALWVESLPRQFLARYKAHGNLVDLGAFAGCIAGCVANLEQANVEKNFLVRPWADEFAFVKKLLAL